jgi:hypothetical protein
LEVGDEVNIGGSERVSVPAQAPSPFGTRCARVKVFW